MVSAQQDANWSKIGKASKEKGKRFEREILKKLNEVFEQGIERRGLGYRGAETTKNLLIPDEIAPRFEVGFEFKYRKTAVTKKELEWMEQARLQANKCFAHDAWKIPVVVRRNPELSSDSMNRTLVTLDFNDFIKLLHQIGPYFG